jgi:long-chain acyl-CoA synthetase
MKPLINGLSLAAANRYENAIAVSVVGGPRVTFREIEERAARFAGGLRALGFKRADRLLLHLPNGWQWIVAYYAVARLGGVVVPANILLSAAEVAYMAADSAATILVMPTERCESVATSCREWNHLSAQIIATGPSPPGNAIPYEALLAAAAAGIEEVAPEDLFTIGYTSGTTGKPKGAMLSHRCVFLSTALTATIHVRRRGDVVVSALPLPHVYGNVVMNASFLVGAQLVLLERFEADVALRSIEAERATMFEGVPTMYYYMLSHANLPSTDLSSLDRCTVGGQTMPAHKIEAVEQAFGCPLLELWGMTEVAGPAISHSPYLPPRPGSIGLVFPTIEAKITDPTDPSIELAPDTPGELLVRGPTITCGYWRNAEATREAITADGWLRTGDIARRDSQGYLYVVDRKKDVIITAGYKIYPAELEHVIALHPAVAMVAVAGTPSDEKGELAKAFIVLRPQSQATTQDIMEHCRSHLAAYKRPRAIEFVEDLPKTSTGKILRRALRGPT